MSVVASHSRLPMRILKLAPRRFPVQQAIGSAALPQQELWFVGTSNHDSPGHLPIEEF